MTTPRPLDDRGGRPLLDAGRLWAGGLATAVTAALVAAVGIVIARGIFDVPVLVPEGEGVWGAADLWRYVVLTGVAALVATALIHVLILFVPRYAVFFGWIVFLATAVAVLAPFTTDSELAAKVATALINLAIGIAIGTLLAGAARSATRVGRARNRGPELDGRT